jgi:hypothetical protein
MPMALYIGLIVGAAYAVLAVGVRLLQRRMSNLRR